MIHVHPLTESTRPAWDRFVHQQCPDASFFQLSGWKAVIERSYRQPCPFLYAERDGQIVGVLPLVHINSRLFGNRLISTAFSIGGGAAAIDDDAYDALDAAMIDLARARGVSCIELRRPARRHDGGGWTATSDIYANFSRPLACAEDACLKQIPRKQRAVVRKAIDAARLCDQAESQPDNFFPLYAFSMRNMGTPVFGRRFFETLMAEFSGHCDCLTVMHEQAPVASVLSFYFRGAVMPYYTGCQPQARELGANDYMYWRLMRRAVDRGCTVFDFGRSKMGTGPYSFKKNWGFEPDPITHEFWLSSGEAPPEINPLNPKYQLVIAAWKRLPLGLANRLGPLIVREIG